MLKLFKTLLLGGSGPTLVRARTRDTAGLTNFAYRMPAGIPGDVNRTGMSPTIEPNIIDTLNPPLAYGIPVALDPTNGIRPIASPDAAVNLYGMLVRPFPTNQQTTTSFFGSNPLGTAQLPPTTGICDVLKKGYMTVKLYGAVAAVPGGAVYVRTQNAGAGQVVGGIEAAADGGNTIQAGSQNTTYFRGAADANGNVEIAWNL